jgi:hypothetical protein
MEESSEDPQAVPTTTQYGPISYPSRFANLVKESGTLDPLKMAVELVEKFAEKDQRSVVIIGSARLETLLENLLKGYLLPEPNSDSDLFDGMGALSTFSARLHLSQQLGLIDKELWRTINLIRDTRNDFAHKVSPGEFKGNRLSQKVDHIYDPIEQTDFYLKEALRHTNTDIIQSTLKDEKPNMVNKIEKSEHSLREFIKEAPLLNSFTKFKISLSACIMVLELGAGSVNTLEKLDECIDLSLATNIEFTKSTEESLDEMEKLIEGTASVYPKPDDPSKLVTTDIPWSKNPTNPEVSPEEAEKNPLSDDSSE